MVGNALSLLWKILYVIGFGVLPGTLYFHFVLFGWKEEKCHVFRNAELISWSWKYSLKFRKFHLCLKLQWVLLVPSVWSWPGESFKREMYKGKLHRFVFGIDLISVGPQWGRQAILKPILLRIMGQADFDSHVNTSVPIVLTVSQTYKRKFR